MRHLWLWSVVLLLTTACVSAQDLAPFEPYLPVVLDQQAQSAAAGDLNGDGLDDVAVAAWPSAVYVLYQQQDHSLGPAVELPSPNMPLGIAIRDLDADGRNDLAAGGTDGLVYLFYQQPDGTLSPPVACYTYGNTNGIAVADLTGDGLLDMATSTASWNALFVLPGLSSGGFGIPSFYTWDGGGGRCATVGDLDSDGRPDLAVLLDDRICWLDSGSGFSAARYLPAQWAHSLASGDLNADGRADLLFTVGTNQPDAAIGVCLQSAGGGFDAAVFVPCLDFPQSVVVADFDNDGLQDAVAIHAGYEALTLWKQTATGLEHYGCVPAPSTGTCQPGALASGDLNGDGKPDLVLADMWNGLAVFINCIPGDVTPPLCTVAVEGRQGRGGWYVSALEVTATAMDEPGGSGVATIESTLDGANWTPYAGPVRLPQDGIYALAFRATDIAGNVSDVARVDLRIDSSSPYIDLAVREQYLWPPSGQTVEVPVDAVAHDGTSGLASVSLEVIDEYGLVEPSCSVTASPIMVPLVAQRQPQDKDGRVYELVVTAEDAAGNIAARSAYVTVPASGPNKQSAPGKQKPPKK